MSLQAEISAALGVNTSTADAVVEALFLSVQGKATILAALQKGNLGDANQLGLGLDMLAARLRECKSQTSATLDLSRIDHRASAPSWLA